MDTLNKALNKGIPSAVVLPVSFADIINISSNQQRTKNILDEALGRYIKKISALTGKSLSFLYSNREAQINTDVETFNKYITISESFIKDILIIALNIDNVDRIIGKNEVPKDTYTEEKARKKLERLNKIKSEEQLKREFPYLYMSYEQITDAKAQLAAQKSHSPIAYFEHIKACNLNKADVEMLENVNTLKDFVRYMSSAIETFIDKYDELSAMATEEQIDSRVFGMNSSKKLELYLADTYTLVAAHSSDQSIKQKCAYYLSAYMFENTEQLDDGTSFERLMSNFNGVKTTKVTKRSVYNKFRQLLIDNPELFNVNFDYHIFNDMTQDEIDALMASYLETLKLQWDIIPEGEEIAVHPEEIERIRKDQETTKKEQGARKDPLELFYEKKTFFDSTEPLIRVMGKDTFDGYIGYIYPNGKVILDKYYENTKTKRLATDVAVYSMGIDDFYKLSQLSKTEIIRDRLCKRFYHRGEWQSKVTKEISGDALTNINQKINVLRQLGAPSDQN